jgi:hypothetical protein
MPHEKAFQAVIRVARARGFVIEASGGERYVVTASHCLPGLLPPLPDTADRTYADLLGPLGAAESSVWAECRFVDPVADIAVLGRPDDQVFFTQADAYNALIGDALPLLVRRAQDGEQGWLFDVGGQFWFSGKVNIIPPVLWITASQPIRGGMSGSPILGDDGKVMGVCCMSGGGENDETHYQGGPNASLTGNLPGWLLEELCPISGE